MFRPRNVGHVGNISNLVVFGPIVGVFGRMGNSRLFQHATHISMLGDRALCFQLSTAMLRAALLTWLSCAMGVYGVRLNRSSTSFFVTLIILMTFFVVATGTRAMPLCRSVVHMGQLSSSNVLDPHLGIYMRSVWVARTVSHLDIGAPPGSATAHQHLNGLSELFDASWLESTSHTTHTLFNTKVFMP